jgi:hypothetical protein
MVRPERREAIRKDKTPYKCVGCDSTWVSQNALQKHLELAPACAEVYRRKLEEAEARVKAASADVKRQAGSRHIPANDRITPMPKGLKSDMRRLIDTQGGIASEDRVMPRQGRMYVTPGIARFWLGFNGSNVEPSYERIETYSQEMEAGRWVDSRSPICFRENGDLCNGQHRLLMHHYTDTGFEYQVELDVTEEEEAAMDIGRKRNIANFLSRGGKIENHRQVAVTATILWAHDDFAIPFNGARTFRSRPMAVQGVILPFVQQHPEIAEAVYMVHNKYKPAARLLKGEGAAAALYVLMSRSQSARAKGDNSKLIQFWSLLSSGQMLQEGSPIYALREQLINSTSNSKLKLDVLEVMAKTIKAFNDFVVNRKRKTVVWRKDEDFPRVI